MRGMRIRIDGPAGCGKTHFARNVIEPAFRAAGQRYQIDDGGEITTGGTQGVPVEVIIRSFRDDDPLDIRTCPNESCGGSGRVVK